MTLKRVFTTLCALGAFLCAFSQPSRPPRPFDSLQPPAHDPAAIRENGTWYTFCTGFGVDILSSDDLVTWNRAGRVFDTPPRWAVETVPGYRGHTWAPDISFHEGKYYLYYSCSSFGKNDSAIGVATSPSLDPSSTDCKWEDHGCVVRSVGGRDDWNAIDPNLFVDTDGTPWLAFGSFWSGIKLVKLDSTLTKVAEPQVWFPLCSRPEGTAADTSGTDDAIRTDPRGKAFDPGNGAVEAPFIVRRGPWYYLFVSYDLCCRGPKSTYKTVVGRSESVCGPYYDRDGVSLLEGGGTVVLAPDDEYTGVGHCSVTSVTGEASHIFFHAYSRVRNYDSVLLVRPIRWSEDGWPSVEL